MLYLITINTYDIQKYIPNVLLKDKGGQSVVAIIGQGKGNQRKSRRIGNKEFCEITSEA